MLKKRSEAYATRNAWFLPCVDFGKTELDGGKATVDAIASMYSKPGRSYRSGADG